MERFKSDDWVCNKNNALGGGLIVPQALKSVSVKCQHRSLIHSAALVLRSPAYFLHSLQAPLWSPLMYFSIAELIQSAAVFA